MIHDHIKECPLHLQFNQNYCQIIVCTKSKKYRKVMIVQNHQNFDDLNILITDKFNQIWQFWSVNFFSALS